MYSILNPKDYLGSERDRNVKSADLFEKMVKIAFGEDRTSVMTGHHIGFEFDNDIKTENEIPSADSLLFCHQIMGAVFGDRAGIVMIQLAMVPAEQREDLLRRFMNLREQENSMVAEESQNNSQSELQETPELQVVHSKSTTFIV